MIFVGDFFNSSSIKYLISWGTRHLRISDSFLIVLNFHSCKEGLFAVGWLVYLHDLLDSSTWLFIFTWDAEQHNIWMWKKTQRRQKRSKYKGWHISQDKVLWPINCFCKLVNKSFQVFGKVAGQLDNFDFFFKLQLKCITTPRHEYLNVSSQIFRKTQISVYIYFILWKIQKDTIQQALLKNS